MKAIGFSNEHITSTSHVLRHFIESHVSTPGRLLLTQSEFTLSIATMQRECVRLLICCPHEQTSDSVSGFVSDSFYVNEVGQYLLLYRT